MLTTRRLTLRQSVALVLALVVGAAGCGADPTLGETAETADNATTAVADQPETEEAVPEPAAEEPEPAAEQDAAGTEEPEPEPAAEEAEPEPAAEQDAAGTEEPEPEPAAEEPEPEAEEAEPEPAAEQDAAGTDSTQPAAEQVIDLPDVQVVDLRTQETLALDDLARPGPTLVWFWAPH